MKARNAEKGNTLPVSVSDARQDRKELRIPNIPHSVRHMTVALFKCQMTLPTIHIKPILKLLRIMGERKQNLLTGGLHRKAIFFI